MNPIQTVFVAGFAGASCFMLVHVLVVNALLPWLNRRTHRCHVCGSPICPDCGTPMYLHDKGKAH